MGHLYHGYVSHNQMVTHDVDWESQGEQFWMWYPWLNGVWRCHHDPCLNFCLLYLLTIITNIIIIAIVINHLLLVIH